MDKTSQRICGTCEMPKDLGDFYKDGKDKEGNTRYRRDCKVCYNDTRLKERRNKIVVKAVPTKSIGTQPKRRKRK